MCRLNQAYSRLPNSRGTDLPQLVFSRKAPLQTHSCALRDKHTALHFLLLPSAFLCLEILGNSAFHFKHVAKRTSPNYYIWPCNKRFTLFLSNFIDTKMTYLKTLRVWRYLRLTFDIKSAIIAKRWVLLFPLFFNTTLACKILNFYDSPTRRRKLEKNFKEQTNESCMSLPMRMWLLSSYAGLLKRENTGLYHFPL